MSKHKCELYGTPAKVVGKTTKHYEPILKPCLCPKNEAKTVKRITSQIWQCPRCGGLGSIKNPAGKVEKHSK
jgi:ribosomal protein L37AE/L43A